MANKLFERGESTIVEHVDAQGSRWFQSNLSNARNGSCLGEVVLMGSQI